MAIKTISSSINPTPVFNSLTFHVRESHKQATCPVKCLLFIGSKFTVSSLCSSYAHRAMRRRKKGPFQRPSYFGTSLSIVRWLFPRPQLFHMVMNLLGQMWFFFFLIQTWSKWERIFASIENDTKPNPLEYYFHFNSYFIINIIIYLKKFLIPIVRAIVFKGAI